MVGNSPSGGCRGDGENARGVTAIRQVAGANLAYRFLPASENRQSHEKLMISGVMITYSKILNTAGMPTSDHDASRMRTA